MLEGTWTRSEEKQAYVWSTSPEAETKYKDVIEKVPDFPFAYFYYALCLRERGDAGWRDYALKGRDIFRKTTAIPHHHSTHDHVLKQTEALAVYAVRKSRRIINREIGERFMID